MTVAELGRRMSSAELTEWMAYAALEPFGPRREDLRAGLVTATLYNVNQGKRGRFFHGEEFLGLTEPVETGPQDITEKARAFFNALPTKPKGKPH